MNLVAYELEDIQPNPYEFSGKRAWRLAPRSLWN